MNANATLTAAEITLLQDISNSLGGLQALLSDYKAQVDEILNVRYDEKVVNAKRRAAYLLKKAHRLEIRASITITMARQDMKRFKLMEIPKDALIKESKLRLEAKQLLSDAFKLDPDNKFFKR